jgi:curved DNA-binding protein CbpA
MVQRYARILFPGEHVDERFLYSLNEELLRKAYRDLVFENHPDRYLHVGVSKTLLSERFKSINEAYQELQKYVSSSGLNRLARSNGSHGFNGSTTARHSTRFSREREDASPFRRNRKTRYFPDEEVMFGQYLYYSGIITLRELIEALSWQRSQRPPFGELAKQWNILTVDDIIHILRIKKGMERFGECALRTNLITPLQFRAVLYRQQTLQKPIGNYFVEKNIIYEKDIQSYLREMKEHNMRIRFRR